jgi:DNA-binding transcriptional MerR regulator
MTTTTKPPPRETWRTWQRDGVSEPVVITRDDLLSRLTTEGVHVNVDNLQNWQEDGVIPYGTRQWHNGATRLMYPPWMFDIVRELREQQAHGWPLSEIARRLRVLSFALQGPADHSLTGAITGTLSAHRNITVSDEGQIIGSETASVRRIPTPTSIAVVPRDIVERLQQWAQEHEETFGVRLARINISLVDEHERPLTFPIDARRA